MTNKAAFLDRDGVINKDSGFVSSWTDFVLIEGVLDALKLLHLNGYKLIIITNQSGIERGFFTEQAYKKLTKKMLSFLKTKQIEITKVYHCPHMPQEIESENCVFRKPNPGMLNKAMNEFDIDMSNSVIFGDKVSDIQAGDNANIGKAYLIESDGKWKNLLACVNDLLNNNTDD